jgi:hypothetical protein
MREEHKRSLDNTLQFGPLRFGGPGVGIQGHHHNSRRDYRVTFYGIR